MKGLKSKENMWRWYIGNEASFSLSFWDWAALMIAREMRNNMCVWKGLDSIFSLNEYVVRFESTLYKGGDACSVIQTRWLGMISH